MSEERSQQTEMLRIFMPIGSIFGIISVFMLWLSMGMMVEFSYNGFDFLLKNSDLPTGYPEVGLYAYLPLIVFAAAIISLIPSVLVFTKHKKKAALAGAVLGATILASALSYVFYPVTKMAFISPSADLIIDIRLMDYLGAGVYFAIVAGIILTVCGLIVFRYAKTAAENG